MRLKLQFRDYWVQNLDIQILSEILGSDIKSHFKQKRDFDCYSYQDSFEWDFDMDDIKKIVNNYYPVEIYSGTITILN